MIGVVKDFHTRSLREKISPFAIVLRPYQFRSLAFKIRPDALEESADFLEETWNRFLPERPFTFYFLDEDFDRLYRQEMKMTQIFGAFAMLAILVACLGLFGLAAFMAERRTKEIGVRKVLGASVAGITLLSRRICPAGCDGECYRVADRLLCDALLASGLCISHFAKSGCLCREWWACVGDCACVCFLSGQTGGNDGSDRSASSRIAARRSITSKRLRIDGAQQGTRLDRR